jgi:hypothetical protein
MSIDACSVNSNESVAMTRWHHARAFDDGDSVKHSLQSSDSRLDPRSWLLKPTLTALQEPLYPIVMGGDHSVTWPVVRGVVESVGQPVDILHFDAHPDMYDCFEGKFFFILFTIQNQPMAKLRYDRGHSGVYLLIIIPGRRLEFPNQSTSWNLMHVMA